MLEEYCPHCNEYTDYNLDDISSGGRITCTHCGRRILACAACFNQCKKVGRRICFDNPDWCKKYHKNKNKNKTRS